MLDLHQPPPSSDTKTYFAHARLPAYIDPIHTSAKKKPFASFLAQPHSHTLDLVLPASTWPLLHPHLAAPRVYARATMRLSDVLDEAFLDAYIRGGGAELLSTVRGDDTAIEIVQGVLGIEMDRATYERAGLVGVAVEDGGRKHGKMRWRVEVDLKLDCMRKGKKGFERLRWAAREVLGQRRVWLFWSGNVSFGESVGAGREVLSQFLPEVFELKPQVETIRKVVGPRLETLETLCEQDDALALLEWLDMLSLGSARVGVGSDVDGHLCRYDVPDFGPGLETRELVRVRWTGFITPVFVKEVFLDVWTAGFKARRDTKASDGEGDVAMDGTDEVLEKWFSMSAQAFGGKNAWTLMQFANRETLVWEVEG